MKIRIQKPSVIQNFEPQSWRDIALIPYWILRWAFAWCWTQVWYPAMRIKIWWRWKGRPLIGLSQHRWSVVYGRDVDPDPVVCSRCLWAGPRRWACHTYRDDGTGQDVEPVDECPRCGGEI